jgi:hypothetical protein
VPLLLLTRASPVPRGLPAVQRKPEAWKSRRAARRLFAARGAAQTSGLSAVQRKTAAWKGRRAAWRLTVRRHTIPRGVVCRATGHGDGTGDIGASHFFSIDDNLLAMLFSHLPGRDLARLACVCTRWREVVQGEGSDEGIWKVLWKRDFEPFILDSPSSTVQTDGLSARAMYARMAAIDQLVSPTWMQVFPTNGHSTVMDRQGTSATVLNGCPIVYGGWTSGWDTIRNDVHVLRRRGSRLEWDGIACKGDFPPPSYGPTVTSLVHPVHGACLATYGGVLYGSYQGPINELRLLIPSPMEFGSQGEGAEAGAAGGVCSQERSDGEGSPEEAADVSHARTQEEGPDIGGGVHRLGRSASEKDPW